MKRKEGRESLSKVHLDDEWNVTFVAGWMDEAGKTKKVSQSINNIENVEHLSRRFGRGQEATLCCLYTGHEVPESGLLISISWKFNKLTGVVDGVAVL